MMNVKANPNMSHWSFENGYADKTNKNSYPMRIFNSRSDAALRVELYLNDNAFYSCGYKNGFRLFLHVPGDVPKMSRQFIYVSDVEDVKLSIKATMTTTSEGLRSYRPDQRQCFFNSENHLRFFKIYTKNNCEAECLANFTRIKCGCVRFSMPSMYLNDLPSRESYGFVLRRG